MIENTETTTPKWIEDARGNKCSVEYFGSLEAAQAALASLKNCDDCINCSRCSGCSDCSGCSGCSDCSRCSRCSGCSDCSDCSRCSRCSGCSDCSDCSDCSRCSRCSGCSDCSDCSDCSRCSRCSGCSRCSDCSRCSNVAYLYDKIDIRAVVADGEAGAPLGQPPIPVIENIHQRVYEAASAPKALNMGDWHTCGTTHCRGGWVVHLAGEAGYALERFHNPLLAAQLIYDASDPTQSFNPCRFFDSGPVALADMKRLAEAEAQPA